MACNCKIECAGNVEIKLMSPSIVGPLSSFEGAFNKVQLLASNSSSRCCEAVYSLWVVLHIRISFQVNHYLGIMVNVKVQAKVTVTHQFCKSLDAINFAAYFIK